MKAPSWFAGPIGGALVVALLAAFVVPGMAGDYGIEFATTLVLWIALVQSWVILSGYTGYVSLGHAAFVGAGAYVFILTWGAVPFWFGLVAAGFTSGLLALIVGGPCLRVRGPYFVILTLGVAEFVKYAVINIEASLGKFGRLMIGTPEPVDIYRMAVGLAAIAFVMALVARYSRFGVGLRAIRENEVAAEMTGIRVRWLKVGAFGLSALVPGVVGALMICRTGYFEPLQMFSPQLSLTIITMCVAGGSDNPWGPLIGALFLNILSELLWDSAPELYTVILGVVLVFVVLRMPEGIYGTAVKRLARRSRKAVPGETTP
ncbi:branched-chain amino acid ABC transporter permease [Zavarzinia compransoris]|uniref:branched-chain amino acid ABC transporter permease n=1 Tax=Zavarzinia marina TaxID=2911065 RepID=UPI001F448E28|nr:branched-chain amino acid ABC transporter permease [Zavarzinia marina]MCF4167370.1 branched-chain amino acid ABC transporter permease [Zavarzinia marina]